ncbi:hypothetical protein CDD80_5182 [Ophiocordyceps camponoti-rufipedis]|uniref:Uncharacterized protein n=1 Tax=Ophiocordyceps camponoti-rufipedis TaxID=2004952 RepID=A0A2C5ZMF5_9HYPO|nr:hypothetical protein CDD80_5182 [Ophiocordyceps camponoti-rufipedis]
MKHRRQDTTILRAQPRTRKGAENKAPSQRRLCELNHGQLTARLEKTLQVSERDLQVAGCVNDVTGDDDVKLTELKALLLWRALDTQPPKLHIRSKLCKGRLRVRDKRHANISEDEAPP